MIDVLCQHCARWFSHAARMDIGRVPKQITIGELPGTQHYLLPSWLEEAPV